MQTDDGPHDAVTLEVFRHLFASLAEEMGAALRRTAFSPNIKERRDYSCAVFDPGGRVVAQGDHMPVHLGSMPRSVAAALETLGPLATGDVALLNDPFAGGTHLPDITMVAPVRHRGDGAAAGDQLLGYVAARAHHADVGGMTPGSMPLAREIHQEGLRIPPVRLRSRDHLREDVLRLLLANVRTPDERKGDLDAQLAALHTGGRRLRALAEARGGRSVLDAMDRLVAYADRLLEEGLRRIPEGTYEAEDRMEDDGFGSGPVPIRVRLRVSADAMEVDFAGSAPRTPGGINAVAAITESATRYVVRCVLERILGVPLPAGGGSFHRVTLRLPEDSVVDARPPAAVAAGNVETSQRITDVLLLAFARALPDAIPALSQGTMNNTAIGGATPDGAPFAYYETVGGGMGAGPSGPGLSGVHSHMTNSLNTPVEALEHAYPLRVDRYGLRRGSGGAGRHAGGDGLRRDLRFRVPAEVTVLSERRVHGPPGARGGGTGAPGENRLLRAHGTEEPLPGKATFRVEAGDVLSVRTPGGGGWGPAGEEPTSSSDPGDGEGPPASAGTAHGKHPHKGRTDSP